MNKKLWELNFYCVWKDSKVSHIFREQIPNRVDFGAVSETVGCLDAVTCVDTLVIFACARSTTSNCRWLIGGMRQQGSDCQVLTEIYTGFHVGYQEHLGNASESESCREIEELNGQFQCWPSSESQHCFSCLSSHESWLVLSSLSVCKNENVGVKQNTHLCLMLHWHIWMTVS